MNSPRFGKPAEEVKALEIAKTADSSYYPNKASQEDEEEKIITDHRSYRSYDSMSDIEDNDEAYFGKLLIWNLVRYKSQTSFDGPCLLSNSIPSNLF